MSLEPDPASTDSAERRRQTRVGRAASDGRSDVLAQVIERNIRALLDRKQLEDRNKPLEERIAYRITRFTGSMAFVYIHLVGFGAWTLLNLGVIPGPRFDPDFVKLATFASVEAIFLSTFVLISQNRMQKVADKRADLDLQVSLLAEHEITQLVTLVTAMAAKMGIAESQDPELQELARDIHPERVLDTMEAQERALTRETRR